MKNLPFVRLVAAVLLSTLALAAPASETAAVVQFKALVHKAAAATDASSPLCRVKRSTGERWSRCRFAVEDLAFDVLRTDSALGTMRGKAAFDVKAAYRPMVDSEAEAQALTAPDGPLQPYLRVVLDYTWRNGVWHLTGGSYEVAAIKGHRKPLDLTALAGDPTTMPGPALALWQP